MYKYELNLIVSWKASNFLSLNKVGNKALMYEIYFDVNKMYQPNISFLDSKKLWFVKRKMPLLRFQPASRLADISDELVHQKKISVMLEQ